MAGSISKTVKLLNNITIDNNQGIVIGEGENIVLDLGGYTLTVGEGFDGWVITNKGTLEITGKGIITDSEITGCDGLINNSGTLTIQNGEFTSKQTGTDSKTLVKVVSGTVTINGGNFSIADDDGSVQDSKLIDIDESQSGTASVVVKGGTFDRIIPDNIIGEGFILTEKDGAYAVVEAVVVTIDGIRYFVVPESTLQGSGFELTAAEGFVITWTIEGVEYTSEELKSVTFDRNVTVMSKVTIVAPTVTVSDSDASLSGTGVVIEANVTNSFSFEVSYQWYLDGTPIEGATGETYIASESGTYSVTVTVSGTYGGQTYTATETVSHSVEFEEWTPPQTMTLYAGFSPFSPLNVIEGVTGKVSAVSGEESVVRIDENGLIAYVGPGEATVTVTFTTSDGSVKREIEMTVLPNNSGIQSAEGQSSPVVEVPDPQIQKEVRETIANNDGIDIPEGVLANATVIDIMVPDADGMPADGGATLTVPFSFFGAGITFDNQGAFTFYIVHVHDGAPERITGFILGENGLTFSVDDFSPFLLAFEQTDTMVPDPEPWYPPYYPWWDDDVYVPPSYVVEETPETDDDSTTAVACAAAAVVAALMAVFLIAEYRRR